MLFDSDSNRGAEVHLIAGEVARKPPQPDEAKRKPILSTRSKWRVRNKQNLGNSALQ